MRQRIDHLPIEILVQRNPARNEWRTTACLVAFAWLSVIGLFWPTIRSMVEMWESSRTFAHGFLIAPATGYLIWSYRERFRSEPPHPSVWGFLAVLATAMLWLAGQLASVVWLQQAAVIAAFPSLVWAILGTEIFQELSWPLGLLFFMLPVGTSLEPWLQELTAGLILMALKIAGISYSYAAHDITISSGTWEVAPDCGGLRYLLPGLALGYIFASLTYRAAIRRWYFLTVCAAILLIANGMRAYGIIIAHHLGIADGADHRLFSYTVFGMTLPFLHWLGLKWADNKTGAPSGKDELNLARTHDGRRLIVTTITAILLIAIAPVCLWIWNGSTPP